MRPLEDLYANVPPDLADADEALRQYGRWSAARSERLGCGSAERNYAAPFRNYDARREPREPMMPARDVVRAHRAFVSVPDLERVVLSVLYVPRRQPIEQQLRLLRITPKQCRERHTVGLRLFANLWRLQAARICA